MFSDAQIKKFQIIYKNLYEVELNLSEVCEKLESLVRVIELTYKPMTEKEMELVKKRRKEMKII